MSELEDWLYGYCECDLKCLTVPDRGRSLQGFVECLLGLRKNVPF